MGLELSTHQAQLYKSPTQVNSKLNHDKLEHVDEAQLVFELSFENFNTSFMKLRSKSVNLISLKENYF